MAHKVQLAYFRPTGKFLTYAYCVVEHEELPKIWEAIHDLRRLGRLPGLRVNAGRDLFILVDVADHPQRVLHMVIPPYVNEDDVTPTRVATGETPPVVRLSLEEMPLTRTTTRDVVRVDVDADTEVQSVDSDEEVTPVEVPIPKPSDT